MPAQPLLAKAVVVAEAAERLLRWTAYHSGPAYFSAIGCRMKKYDRWRNMQTNFDQEKLHSSGVDSAKTETPAANAANVMGLLSCYFVASVM